MAEVQGLVERTVDPFSGLHCAFNNAGILPPTLPLAQQEADVVDRAMAINVRGVFPCLKLELRHMVRAGGGAIVNTPSDRRFFPDVRLENRTGGPGRFSCVRGSKLVSVITLPRVYE